MQDQFFIRLPLCLHSGNKLLLGTRTGQVGEAEGDERGEKRRGLLYLEMLARLISRWWRGWETSWSRGRPLWPTQPVGPSETSRRSPLLRVICLISLDHYYTLSLPRRTGGLENCHYNPQPAEDVQPRPQGILSR